MTGGLSIDDLQVVFSTRNGPVEALRGISLELGDGETLGVVGESGSGKSVTAYAITRLLETSGKIVNGRIVYKGSDITRLSESDLRTMRGASISMIFQNPRAALNPIRAIGLQIADAIRAHTAVTAKEARAEALDLLKSVMIRDPEARLDAYPHELSGGMCQRVMIAIAIACRPHLLIADEPTTGLDVTTQKTVMTLLARITAERNMSMILITHDLGLAAQYCDKIVVMENGRIVERGTTRTIFLNPQHPYTRRLVAASPTPTSTIDDLARVAEAEQTTHALSARPAAKPYSITDGAILLQIRNLTKRYSSNIIAVNDVSFDIPVGGSVGLVGESGSGKTTVSRMISRLIEPSDGKIIFDSKDIGAIPARVFHSVAERRDIQLVFQDPDGSLNPRFSVFDCIADPLRKLEKLRNGKELRERVRETAARAGLADNLLSRFPHQLSGGQKARVGIARAISIRPRLLVLDEPTAALDVSVQAIILNLLDRLRREDNMAFLFVSHDLNVVRMMCERVVVMRLGKVEEIGGSSLFGNPQSPYTRSLLDAIPHFDPNGQQIKALPKANEYSR
ncbi:dipeptide ABC transporter ATP-binding protein [Bradyrhizobium mercantei]|uniref:dipeptide ABC transporter ATP-binding protein n=1 Tax=Bradyrhizobium mercantei TaxID=1904807 RepID=UPI000975A27C|nr:ABC transporter ATP-binding protein [Bradyrhizobium mercantei]